MRTIFTFMIIVFFTCTVIQTESQPNHRVLFETTGCTEASLWGEEIGRAHV